MSFASDLNTLMNADSALNALVDGIYFQNLPDNSGMDESNILYLFDLVESVDVIALNTVYKRYDVEIIILTNDTATRANIAAAVETYLNNYSDSNFQDVVLIDSKAEVYGEKEQYVEILTYRIIYFE